MSNLLVHKLFIKEKNRVHQHPGKIVYNLPRMF